MRNRWQALTRVIRRSLGLKLFLSYGAVLLVGSLTLWWAGQSVAPVSFERHMATMARVMEDMMRWSRGMDTDNDAPTWWQDDPARLERDLFRSFRAALSEALLRAMLVAGLAAMAVSWLVTRQIVAPIQAISRASQRIAQGQYDERVAVPGDLAHGLLDELGELA